MQDPRAVLGPALGDLADVLASVTEDEGWEPTGCRGWSVLDLAYHLVDSQGAAMTVADRAELGALAERFPLFG